MLKSRFVRIFVHFKHYKLIYSPLRKTWEREEILKVNLHSIILMIKKKSLFLFFILLQKLFKFKITWIYMYINVFDRILIHDIYTNLNVYEIGKM